ncbi:uridine kinase [candidate division KSB1 bacterium 4572_119]|nr:MAG: uridine kinase [candidate division KSB1 bacterium 4572_119]
MKSIILIGIAGGTGSGKTLVSKRIYDEIGSDKVTIIQQDSYYKELANLSFEERKKQNFDHPDAFDHDLLFDHLIELLSGHDIEMPLYDFKTHSRKKKTQTISDNVVIVLEGILILHNPAIRNILDIKVYVDTADDIRLIRRIRRDVQERGRSLDSILEQYENSVRPMQLQFVEPTKRYADIILPEGGYNLVAIDLLKTKIQALLKERGH